MIGDQEIKEGEWVCVFNGSGNHDPGMFENPSEFIMNRPNVGKNLTSVTASTIALPPSLRAMKQQR